MIYCSICLLLLLVSANTPTADRYLVGHRQSWCSSHTILSTIEDCKHAKAALDPNAAAVQNAYDPYAPKGCSRFKRVWFFNSHYGQVDGVSEPICKASAGEPTNVCPDKSRCI